MSTWRLVHPLPACAEQGGASYHQSKAQHSKDLTDRSRHQSFPAGGWCAPGARKAIFFVRVARNPRCSHPLFPAQSQHRCNRLPRHQVQIFTACLPLFLPRHLERFVAVPRICQDQLHSCKEAVEFVIQAVATTFSCSRRCRHHKVSMLTTTVLMHGPTNAYYLLQVCW